MRGTKLLRSWMCRLAVGKAAVVAFGFATPGLAADDASGGRSAAVAIDESILYRRQSSGSPEALIKAGLGDWRATDALRALSAGLLLAYGVLLLARRRKRSAAAELEERDLHDRQVSDAVAAIRSGVEDAGGIRFTPRSLPHSPFTAEHAATFESQIEVAAEACVRLSRTIGLIYFEVPAYADIARREGKSRADEIVSALAEAMRRYLRATDHVEIIDGNQIVVCICLLDKATDLENVAKRLAIILQRHKLGAEGNALVRPGLAVYPMHGYSGAELIAASRRSYREAAAGEPLEPWVSAAEIAAFEPNSVEESEATASKAPAPAGRPSPKLTVVQRVDDDTQSSP